MPPASKGNVAISALGTHLAPSVNLRLTVATPVVCEENRITTGLVVCGKETRRLDLHA